MVIHWYIFFKDILASAPEKVKLLIQIHVYDIKQYSAYHYTCDHSVIKGEVYITREMEVHFLCI